MDSQTAAKWVIETCETYKTQQGHYPAEIKVSDEVWHALHGEACSKIVFPLPANNLNIANFDISPTLPLPEIPLVILTKQS